MKFSIRIGLCLLLIAGGAARAGETAVVTLKGFCDSELKSAGIEVRKTTTIHIKATGGGGRKNRMGNTTIVLERGDYNLHWKSDDSHSYGDWNVDPPEDQQYWGITLYRDEGVPLPPAPPAVPAPPGRIDED